jgi:hypothetical protein
MNATLLIAFFLSLVPQTTSQSATKEIKVAVVALDPETVPFTASGEATSVNSLTSRGIESQYELKGQITNNTPKPIVAFEVVVDLDLGYAVGVRSTEYFDSFLARNYLNPGSSTDISQGPAKAVIDSHGRKPPMNIYDIPSTKEPHAEVRVVFVQFADGSTFGKSEWGDKLADQRKNHIILIKKLLLAYDDGADRAFSAALDKELSQPNLSEDSLSLLNEIRNRLDKKGADDVIRFLKTLVRNTPN